MRLTGNVLLVHPDTRKRVILAAGDEVPDWAVDSIQNPKLIAEEPTAPDDDRPPVTGKGSGKGAWADYAESLGLEVPEGATRDDIVALVDDNA